MFSQICFLVSIWWNNEKWKATDISTVSEDKKSPIWKRRGEALQCRKQLKAAIKQAHLKKSINLKYVIIIKITFNINEILMEWFYIFKLKMQNSFKWCCLFLVSFILSCILSLFVCSLSCAYMYVYGRVIYHTFLQISRRM